MPEAPDLEVIKDFLNECLRSVRVEVVKVTKPIVLRSLVPGEFAQDIRGRQFREVRRRGKFLLLELSGDRLLIVNPMLTGGLQYCLPSVRVTKRTFLIFSLASGSDLRYFDDSQMGMVYYLERSQIGEVPRIGEQGPDILNCQMSFQEFAARLRRYHGEIKGILTRGIFISGIGNAYSDEILFGAGIFPFRKRGTLSQEELRLLYDATYSVPRQAVPVLRKRMANNIHLKIRDFLQVHGKGGKPCPRCGNAITRISANLRITDYCRRCQPGMLIRN